VVQYVFCAFIANALERAIEINTLNLLLAVKGSVKGKHKE
jgi:hypothetical protein